MYICIYVYMYFCFDIYEYMFIDTLMYIYLYLLIYLLISLSRSLPFLLKKVPACQKGMAKVGHSNLRKNSSSINCGPWVWRLIYQIIHWSGCKTGWHRWRRLHLRVVVQKHKWHVLRRVHLRAVVRKRTWHVWRSLHLRAVVRILAGSCWRTVWQSGYQKS